MDRQRLLWKRPGSWIKEKVLFELKSIYTLSDVVETSGEDGVASHFLQLQYSYLFQRLVV